MKYLMKAVLVLLVSLLAWPAWAQEEAMKAFPGYVDFGQLSEVFGEPSVQIAVGESLLGMVSALSAEEDPEAAELFKRLKGVRINVFETQGIAENAVDYVKSASTSLGSTGWESVVSVNSPEEQVRIFMKIDDDLVQGITVMAVEANEAVFINVIGNLNPAELEKVMENFDVDLENDDEGEDAEEN